MNQKGQALLVILLIAAAAFGYLIYSGKINFSQKQVAQTSKSDASPVPTGTGETVYTEATRTANWKTYTNNKYNFSFKYPSDWVIKPLPTSASPWEALLLHSGDATYETTGLGSLSNGMEITVNVLKKDSAVLPASSIADNSFVPDNLFGKVQGFRRSEYYQVGVHVAFGESTYLFNCFAARSTDSDNTGAPCMHLLNQILSTFKFTQ